MTSSATSSAWREPWLDGDDVVLARGPAGRGRPAGPGPRRGRRLDLRPDPGAVQRPDPRPRVRRRRLRRRRRHRRLLGLRRRPAVPARPGRRGARRRSRRAGPWRYADLRRRSARRRFLRGPRGPRPATAAGRRTRSSPSRSTAATRAVLVSGPDFVAAPRLSPDGDAAGLARVGPPGHALGRDPRCGSPPLERRRLARRVDAGRRRPGRVDRPARVVARTASLHFVCGPERLVEPVPPRRRARGSSRWRRWRPSSPTRTGSSAARRTGSSPTARSWRSAARAGRDHLFHVAPDGRVGELEIPYHRVRRAPVGAERRSSRSPARRPSRPSSPASTRRPWPVRRPAPGEHGDARPGDDLAPGADRVPDRPATGPPTRSSTRRPTRRSRPATASCRRSS